MSIQIDVSELRTLAADLGKVPNEVQKGIRPIVQRGAWNIKKTMQADMRSSVHFGQITPSISYDTKVDGDGVEAEIGPDKGRAGGALANIAIFGTSTGGGTVPDPQIALAAESDGFERALGALLDGLL